jgi:hypothetical protein
MFIQKHKWKINSGELESISSFVDGGNIQHQMFHSLFRFPSCEVNFKVHISNHALFFTILFGKEKELLIVLFCYILSEQFLLAIQSHCLLFSHLCYLLSLPYAAKL